MRRMLLLAAALLSAGCVDLAEPRIPNLGAPAVFNFTIRQIPGLPLDASGTLSAGRDSTGARRRVLTPLVVLGLPFPVGEPNAQGTYILSAKPPQPADFAGPYDVQPPLIDGIAQPASFRWFGIRRLDPDTVRPDSAGDVTLRVESNLGPPQPASRSQQWFLELRGDFTSIRVSGDGPPPPVLRIPSQFIPPAPDKRVEAILIYFQSATVISSPPNYIASLTLDLRLQWNVRLP